MQKLLTLCGFILLLLLPLSAQQADTTASSGDSKHKTQNSKLQADTTGFPATWSGSWHGTLDIFNGGGKVQSVAMWIEIYPIDTSTTGRYTFGLVYGSKQQDWRPYELVPVAPQYGLWKVDEKNGIAMESYLFGPKLLCWFTVQNSRVLCTYEKQGDEMIFEVYSGMETAISTSGNVRHNGEAIPEVKTFPFSVFQRAILKKQE